MNLITTLVNFGFVPSVISYEMGVDVLYCTYITYNKDEDRYEFIVEDEYCKATDKMYYEFEKYENCLAIINQDDEVVYQSVVVGCMNSFSEVLCFSFDEEVENNINLFDLDCADDDCDYEDECDCCCDCDCDCSECDEYDECECDECDCEFEDEDRKSVV